MGPTNAAKDDSMLMILYEPGGVHTGKGRRRRQNSTTWPTLAELKGQFIPVNVAKLSVATETTRFVSSKLDFLHILLQPCYGSMSAPPSSDCTRVVYPLQPLTGDTSDSHFRRL